MNIDLNPHIERALHTEQELLHSIKRVERTTAYRMCTHEDESCDQQVDRVLNFVKIAFSITGCSQVLSTHDKGYLLSLVGGIRPSAVDVDVCDPKCWIVRSKQLYELYRMQKTARFRQQLPSVTYDDLLPVPRRFSTDTICFCRIEFVPSNWIEVAVWLQQCCDKAPLRVDLTWNILHCTSPILISMVKNDGWCDSVSSENKHFIHNSSDEVAAFITSAEQLLPIAVVHYSVNR